MPPAQLAYDQPEFKTICLGNGAPTVGWVLLYHLPLKAIPMPSGQPDLGNSSFPYNSRLCQADSQSQGQVRETGEQHGRNVRTRGRMSPGEAPEKHEVKIWGSQGLGVSVVQSQANPG